VTAETIVMGSSPETADTVIHGDPYISPRHCRITRSRVRLTGPRRTSTETVILVEDLGSTNGTWINGHRIYGPTELRIGDLLKIGKTEREIPPTAFWTWRQP
jgi:pSer/pThr/pTyr-binding forkhead associated (FHA) protein